MPAIIPPTIWCDYLSWLSYAVPGMLDRRNVDAMDYALQRLPSNAPLLEIGSFCGLSTCVLSFLIRKHRLPNRLFTCDSWLFEGQVLGAPLAEGTTVTHDEYRRFVQESFRRNVSTFCSDRLPQTIESDSGEFFALWSANAAKADVFGHPAQLGGPISFAYIDGCHAYDGAKRDFENTDRFLVPGGFILFDDSGDGSGWEVCRVIQEILAAGRYELISHNPNYLFRKK